MLLKQVTASLKTWSRVPKRFLTTGLTFGITSKGGRPEALLAGVPVGAQVQFEYLSGIHLVARARTSSGGPSLDGWSASELKFLPLEVFNLVSSFFLHCLSVGEVPMQFLESRMICIPKTDYQINTADCRPITILSAFWRLWCSCMCQSRDVKNWLQQNLLPEVVGITGEELYTSAIKIFDSFGSQNYILGMDYTKAFDVLDPQVTKALLKKHGWPDDLIRLLVLVWSNNRRFICWGHHVHPFPLQGPSMPQGDPFDM